jgi:sugar (pentulose or hexulose) kinase
LAKTYSNLARQRGWADLFPPLRKAGDILGPLSDQWMTRCQLQNPVDVHCGIHDSNAALIAARGIPDINKGEATIISTGTWFVAMRAPATSLAFGLASLDPARDCLVNVDIEGRPVPSARFMGGREIELLIANGNYQLEAAEDQDAMVAAVPSIIDRGAMIRPGTVAGVGPFPAGKGGWINMPTDNIARRTAIAIYVALIADTCLDLIESRHKILVEGRFAGSAVFMRALATLRPNQIILAAEADNDVSFGALRVITPKLRSRVTTRIAQQLPVDLKRYKAMWQSLALSESII